MKRDLDISDSTPIDSDSVDSLCDRFERELRCGARPLIETYLENVDERSERTVLLRELLILELDYRWRAGEKVDEESFVKRFPGHEASVQEALRLAVGYAFPHRREQASTSLNFLSAVFSSRSGGETNLLNREPKEESRAARRLGQYELLRMVGVGGFSNVWKARDLTLDRIVAVKIPHERIDSEVEMERFLREARAAAKLRHPNIVPIHDVGREKDVVFLVSEFIQGATLAECMATASLTPRAAVELVAVVADGLQYAHSNGVVHRDVKPANLLLDLQGRPHIADFGLAKRLDEASSHCTVDGNILGTPAYMSPELAAGKSGTADERTDVYSLGVVLFQLLTEELPFRGTGVTLLDRIRAQEPPSPRTLNQAIPQDLATICLKCLEKDPARRYASAAALADDLRCWLEHRPIKARRTGVFGKLVRWTRRRPMIAALVATLAVATTVGTMGVAWQWREAVAAQKRFAMSKVDALLSARPESVPVLLGDLEVFSPMVRARLEQILDSPDASDQERMRIRMALLASDHSHVEPLVDSMLSVEPSDFGTLRDALSPHAGALNDRLWSVATNAQEKNPKRLRSACALASYATQDPRWADVSPAVARWLAEMTPGEAKHWAGFLTPIAERLRVHLAIPLLDPERPKRRASACQALCQLHADHPDILCRFVEQVDREQLRDLAGALRSHGDKGVATLQKQLIASNAAGPAGDAATVNTALTLLMLDAGDAVWPLFQHRVDPTVRTELLHAVSETSAPPATLMERLPVEPNVSARRALLLALGQYDKETLDAVNRLALTSFMEKLFEDDPDPGVHSAAEWTLRRWGAKESLEKIRARLVSSEPRGNRRWYVNKFGHTLALVPISTADGKSYDLAVSTTEATIEQVRRFNENVMMKEAIGTDGRRPAHMITYWDSAAYCRWLSEQEGIPESQRGYPKDPLPAGKGNFPVPDRMIEGYRLPTADEWQIACAAGATTPLFFGRGEHRTVQYAWIAANSLGTAHPVAELKPNDFGLFDVEGNVFEWSDSMPGEQKYDKVEKVPRFVGRNLHHHYLGASYSTLNHYLPPNEPRQKTTVRSAATLSMGFRPVRRIVQKGG